jgi:hypothetical protein
VDLVTARAHLDSNVSRHFSAWYGWGEAMLGVMAMSIFSKAWLAEVIILAVHAVKELTLVELCAAMSVEFVDVTVDSKKQKQSR